MGGGLLIPYVLIALVFTYFIGIPPLVNSLRCVESYKDRQGTLVATLLFQVTFAAVMILLLTWLRIGNTTPLFLLLGVIRALSMPRQQLMQERIEVRSNQGIRDGAQIMYFRSIPERRLGAPNWNKPWTPPDGFPRARFFRKLKEVHPGLDDLDAAYLIEDAICSFDDLPAKEPMRSQSLIQRVDSEIKLYCSWSTTRVAAWARNPGRTTGRNAI